MSKIERLQIIGTRKRTSYSGGVALQPVGVAYPRVAEYLRLTVLFVVCAGFWGAVVWWLFV